MKKLIFLTFLVYCLLLIDFCVSVDAVHSQSTRKSARKSETGDVLFRNRVVEVEPAIPLHRKLNQKVERCIRRCLKPFWRERRKQ